MTLSERTDYCLRCMADLAAAGDEDWLCWYAEYCGLRGERQPLEWRQDARLREIGRASCRERVYVLV